MRNSSIVREMTPVQPPLTSSWLMIRNVSPRIYWDKGHSFSCIFLILTHMFNLLVSGLIPHIRKHSPSTKIFYRSHIESRLRRPAFGHKLTLRPRLCQYEATWSTANNHRNQMYGNTCGGSYGMQISSFRSVFPHFSYNVYFYFSSHTWFLRKHHWPYDIVTNSIPSKNLFHKK